MLRTIYTSEPETLSAHLSKIWRYRALIITFAVRDLRTKYAQTVLGLGWTILQPLTALAIFSFFFGHVLGWRAGDLPYSLYVLSGLLGWNFFAYIVIQGSQSLQDSGHLIRKIYFPKALLPLSKVCVATVELGISTLLLVPLMLWHAQALSWRVVLLPVVVLLNASIALFLVFVISALAYRKRDLFHLMPFLMYFGIWTAPIFFTDDVMPGAYRFIWHLNPIACVTEAWRYCLFSDAAFDPGFIPGMLVCVPLSFLGLWYFSRNDRLYSDFA
ncbi:MAG: ABC transporter permease [Flavobacteriales bacterium]|nr:ABC transporter permease [Flavobacteriales bacterium]